jgi:hypothetical protein
MLFLIYSSFFGTNIGIGNPSIILIWIGWWVLLVFLFLPFNAKSWCSICPIPVPSIYYHRYSKKNIIKRRVFPRNKILIGIPIFLFILFSSLSIPLSTIPIYTGITLLFLLVFGTITDLIFGKRTFCKKICPINPLLNVYDRLNITRVKPINYQICANPHEKTCISGDNDGTFGCEWGFYPAKLKENQCTSCFDCFKSCSYDNLSLSLTKGKKIIPNNSEKISWINSFTPIFFLSIIIIYTVSKIGSIDPFHNLMLVSSLETLIIYFVFELVIIFLILPALYSILVLIPTFYVLNKTRSKENIISVLKRQSYTTIPLSLAAWISFTLILIFPNLSLVFSWISNILNLGNGLYYLTNIDNYFSVIYIFGINIAQIILFAGFFSSIYLAVRQVMNLEIEIKNKISIMFASSTFTFFISFIFYYSYMF